MAQALAPQTVKFGHHIFVYSNLRTNQVIYSLTRALNNNASLKQIPFLGKKTVPAKLRKDLWQPLALVEFPSPFQGLAAYRKLREFRRLHETTYPLEIITQTEGRHKNQLLGTKKRGKVLMNQKANSVADIAAVLQQQEVGPSDRQIQGSMRRIRNVQRMKRQKGPEKVKKAPLDVRELGGVEGVRIRWANLLDAEYAETWPAAVLHDALEQSRYTAAFPPWERESVPERVVSEVEAGAEALESVISGKHAEDQEAGVLREQEEGQESDPIGEQQQNGEGGIPREQPGTHAPTDKGWKGWAGKLGI